METTNEPPGDRSAPSDGEPPDTGRPQHPARPRTQRERPRAAPKADPKTAGFLLVAAIIFGGGIGLGLGALIGAPAPFAIVGVFAGLGLGFRLVYSRFRDI